MTNVRWRVLLLFLWIVLFFNIERLNIVGTDTINLASGVYVVGMLALLIAFMPIFQQRSLVIVLIPVLLLHAVIVAFDTTPDFGGIYTYLTLTGLLLVVVTTALTHLVSQALHEFHQAVEMITFANIRGRLRSLDDVQDTVYTEMDSSRRSQHPLSLVLLQFDASSLRTMMHRLIQEVQLALIQRYTLTTIANVLARSVRKTDLIIHGRQPNRIILVAPETAEQGANALATRITHVVREHLGLAVQSSTATFPSHALTFEDLLQAADKQLSAKAAMGNPATPMMQGHYGEPELPRLPEACASATGDSTAQRA